MNEYLYYIMRVEKQTRVENVEINDGETNYGVEPTSVLLLKDIGMFPIYHIAAELHGKKALYRFKKDDLVAVSLSVQRVKKNGEFTNYVSVNDIKLVQEPEPIIL